MGRKKSPTSDMDVREKQLTPLARQLSELITDANALKEHLGVTMQAVNQYKLGLARPSLENLCKIADFYGVTTDYLLGRTKTRTINEDVATAIKTTGLSETAIKKLCHLRSNPHEWADERAKAILNENSNRLFALVSTLIESGDFVDIFSAITDFIRYGSTTPSETHDDLKQDEIDRVVDHIHARGSEIVPNYAASEIALKISADKFQAVFRAVLEQIKEDGQHGKH